MNKIPFTRKVIVGGLPRSGSSLFRNLLNGHPRIVAPPETAIFIREWSELQRRASQMGKRLEGRLGMPANQVVDHINSSRDEVEFFETVMADWLTQNGRHGVDTWVEKTPRNCLRYKQIAEQFPDILFVSTIRDGRDVVTSRFPGQSEYYCSVERYIETIESILGFDNYRHVIIKYEDLASDPQGTIKRVLDFINIDWDPGIFKNYLSNPGLSRMEEVSAPVTTKSVGRFNNPEHAERLREFQESRAAMDCLRATGYI